MYTKEKLVSLCESAVVPYTKWNDPYSYIAQAQLAQAYMALMADCEYEIDISDSKYISIGFRDVTGMLDRGKYLGIDSLDDYLEEYPDYEMYDATNIWSGELLCYIPTQKTLDKARGFDWFER